MASYEETMGQVDRYKNLVAAILGQAYKDITDDRMSFKAKRDIVTFTDSSLFSFYCDFCDLSPGAVRERFVKAYVERQAEKSRD